MARRVLTDNGSVPVPSEAELSDLPSSVTTAYVQGQLWFKNQHGFWQPQNAGGVIDSNRLTFTQASTTTDVLMQSSWRYSWGSYTDLFYLANNRIYVYKTGLYKVSISNASLIRSGLGDSYGMGGNSDIFYLPANGWIHPRAWIGSITAPATRAFAYMQTAATTGATVTSYGAIPATANAIDIRVRIELVDLRA